MKGWNHSAVEKLVNKGMVKKEQLGKKPEPAGLSEIKSILIKNSVRFELEYRFHDKRLFRFDVYLPDYKIGIEYEGLVSDVSGHLTYEGYSKDCTKYNMAWLDNKIPVLRYTAFNFNEFEQDINKIINGFQEC